MLFIHEIGHILIYLLLVIPIILVKKKNMLRYVFIGFVFTMFMDSDHAVDYFLHRGLVFNISEFFHGNYFTESGKLFVLLHAWEYIPILLILCYIFKRHKPILYSLLFITFGLSIHLFYDTVYYCFNPLGYSIIYRIINGFSLSVLHI